MRVVQRQKQEEQPLGQRANVKLSGVLQGNGDGLVDFWPIVWVQYDHQVLHPPVPKKQPVDAAYSQLLDGYLPNAKP